MTTRAQLDATAAAMRVFNATKGSGCRSTVKAIAGRLDPNLQDRKYLESRGWLCVGEDAFHKGTVTFWSKHGKTFPQHFALWLERNNVNQCWW